MFDWKDDGLFGWNYKYLFFHPWVIVGESYRRAKWFIQRGWRGYSDADVWDLHSYLSRTLPKALRQLRDNKTGTPMVMFTTEALKRENGELTDEECAVAHLKWLTMLEDMARGFDAVYAFDDELPYPETDRAKELKAQRDKGLALFIEFFECLWD